MTCPSDPWTPPCFSAAHSNALPYEPQDVQLGDVELPGQYLSGVEVNPDGIIYLEGIGADVAIVRRNSSSFRRLSLLCSDGHMRHMLVQVRGGGACVFGRGLRCCRGMHASVQHGSGLRVLSFPHCQKNSLKPCCDQASLTDAVAHTPAPAVPTSPQTGQNSSQGQADERMMQLLRLLNRPLERSPETRRRNLAWYTPIIVPVWPQVGFVCS